MSERASEPSAQCAGRVESVNVAVVRIDPWTHVKSGRSGIDERPVDGPVLLEASGLHADTICDTKHPGNRCCRAGWGRTSRCPGWTVPAP